LADELTDAQLTELEADLHALVGELSHTLASTREAASTVHLDQAAVGRLSRVDAMQRQQMVKAQQRRVGLRLKQAAVALAAFKTDDYGWCKRCGEAIAYKRMKARPETVVCVPCQVVLEEGRG
jgi:DnaK suppressor protein